jgi:kynureninase
VTSRFYKPSEERTKIYIDSPSFPSDIYAMKSVIERMNLDVDSNLIVQKPREGENINLEEDILDFIENEGSKI